MSNATVIGGPPRAAINAKYIFELNSRYGAQILTKSILAIICAAIF